MVAPLPPTGVPIVPPTAPSPAGSAPTAAAPGFGEMVAGGLEQVSALEHRADIAATDIATGGSTSVVDLMTATSKAQVGVELLVQVRNRAVSAYQEIMRLQV